MQSDSLLEVYVSYRTVEAQKAAVTFRCEQLAFHFQFIP